MKLASLGARPVTVPGVLLLASLCTVLAITASGQDRPKSAPPDSGSRPTFSEADAAHTLDNVRQALESDNSGHFLKLFDAEKMPGFAAFRDQVDEFFEKYSPIRMNYRVMQVATEGEFGAVVVEITLEATARQALPNNIRRTTPVRLVCGWNGKTWKIVDWSPREFFR
jgi:hypothetical protein